MKTFVVNLDKNTERLSLIDSQLKGVGVEYERIRAVYGKELSAGEKDQSVNRLAFWCLRGYPIRDGEIGCALSHLKVYRKMLEADVPIACVLEDDADPHASLPGLLKWLEEKLDVHKPIVALISNHGNRESADLSLYPIRSGAYTDGYVITKPAAAKILEQNYPIKGPSDSWTFWRSRGWIELYQATPAGCNQLWHAEGYTSDVSPEGASVTDASRMGRMQKICWKLKRALGVMLAAVLYR